jgi:hypothetical protein
MAVDRTMASLKEPSGEPSQCPLWNNDEEVISNLKTCVQLMRELVDATSRPPEKAIFQAGLDLVADTVARMQKIDIVGKAYTDQQNAWFDWMHDQERDGS